jgi:hypothetical protein
MTPPAGKDSGTIKLIGSETTDLAEMLVGVVSLGKSTWAAAQDYCCNEV